MKQRNFIIILAALGVFIFIDTSLLAQTTGVRTVQEIEREALARERSRESARARESYVYVTGYGNSEHNSKLMLSKHYDGQSIDKQGTFDIESNTTKLKLSIDGQVVSGSITVSLIMPDGKPYKSLTIDDSADIRWSESLNIKEGEKKYYGSWKYRITTKVADGSYHLSINTY